VTEKIRILRNNTVVTLLSYRGGLEPHVASLGAKIAVSQVDSLSNGTGFVTVRRLPTHGKWTPELHTSKPPR